MWTHARWEEKEESGKVIKYSVTPCQDTDRGKTVIKVNSTSKAWLKPLFKLKVNVEAAHVALYKCVSKILLRILMMMEAEWLNSNDLVFMECDSLEGTEPSLGCWHAEADRENGSCQRIKPSLEEN